MQVVKFLSGWKQYNAGETAGFENADHLINAGIAIPFDQLPGLDEDKAEPEQPASDNTPVVPNAGTGTDGTVTPTAGPETPAGQGAGPDAAGTDDKAKAGKGKSPSTPDAPPQG